MEQVSIKWPTGSLQWAIASGRPFAEIDAPEPTPWIVREGRRDSFESAKLTTGEFNEP